MEALTVLNGRTAPERRPRLSIQPWSRASYVLGAFRKVLSLPLDVPFWGLRLLYRAALGSVALSTRLRISDPKTRPLPETLASVLK